MKILFLDTNVFIQCCELGQLPWDEICKDDEHLLLLIPKTVQEEINKHKQDGNQRRAKKARKTNSLFKEIIFSEGAKLVIKDSKPVVKISLAPLLSKDCQLPDVLDLSQPDDRIIAEMIRYKNKNPDHDISLFSHDSNLLNSAQYCGLSCIPVPDSWLLPPEPDSRDKIITNLGNRIKELEKNYPIIEVSSVDASGNKTNRISVNTIRYRQLNENELHELLNEVKQLYPMKTIFHKEPPEFSINHLMSLGAVNAALGYFQEFIPTSDDEINKYQNEEYPAWIDKVKKYLLSLPEKFEEPTRNFSFSIILGNNGNVPAENIIVEFKAIGDIFFKPPLKKDENNNKNDTFILPSPPKPPVDGHWITKKSSMHEILDSYKNSLDVDFIMNSRKNLLDTYSNSFNTKFTSRDFSPFLQKLPELNIHDRDEFYWKNGKSTRLSKSWVFECEEFRHKIKKETFNFTILLPPSEKDIVTGVVECSISARNLPIPINYYVNFSIRYVEGKTYDETRKYLKIL